MYKRGVDHGRVDGSLEIGFLIGWLLKALSVFHARGSKFLEMSRADGYSASQESHPIGKRFRWTKWCGCTETSRPNHVQHWSCLLANHHQRKNRSLVVLWALKARFCLPHSKVITHVQKHCILEVCPWNNKISVKCFRFNYKKTCAIHNLLEKKPWKIWGQNLNKKWEK